MNSVNSAAKLAPIYDIKFAKLRKFCGFSHAVSDAEIKERLKRPKVQALLAIILAE